MVCNARCANCTNCKLCNGGVAVYTPITCNAYCPIEPFRMTDSEWFAKKTETEKIVKNGEKVWNFMNGLNK